MRLSPVYINVACKAVSLGQDLWRGHGNAQISEENSDEKPSLRVNEYRVSLLSAGFIEPAKLKIDVLGWRY